MGVSASICANVRSLCGDVSCWLDIEIRLFRSSFSPLCFLSLPWRIRNVDGFVTTPPAFCTLCTTTTTSPVGSAGRMMTHHHLHTTTARYNTFLFLFRFLFVVSKSYGTITRCKSSLQRGRIRVLLSFPVGWIRQTIGATFAKRCRVFACCLDRVVWRWQVHQNPLRRWWRTAQHSTTANFARASFYPGNILEEMMMLNSINLGVCSGAAGNEALQGFM